MAQVRAILGHTVTCLLKLVTPYHLNMSLIFFMIQVSILILQVRTVLDIGCGFGSFGAYLFTKQVLTLCIANYESSGSQVQITLERGIPAILASFTSKQLPFPYLSFDMLHCTRCGIEWEMNGTDQYIRVVFYLRFRT